MESCKYKCVECYKVYDDEIADNACICEIPSGKQPSVCLLSDKGLCKWTCMHEHMEIVSYKTHFDCIGSDAVTWLTQIEKCTGCDYQRQGITKRYKFVPFEE